MTRPLFVPVLLGTPRQGRMSEHAARVVLEEVGKRPGVETESIDVATLPIPIDDAGESAKDPAFAELDEPRRCARHRDARSTTTATPGCSSTCSTRT